MQSVSEISSLSHDIRNMMATILMSAEVLEGSSNPETSSVARRISKAAGACAVFCSAAIEMQHARAWSHNVDPIDIPDIIEEVVVQLDTAEHNIPAFHIDCPQPLLATLCQARLYRVLFNILVNSRSALAGRQDGWIAIRAHCQNNALVIDIEDNGPGFGWRFRPCASKPGRSAKPIRGFQHGIGLPTAFALTRELGGRLTLVRTGPAGTLFRLNLENCVSYEIMADEGTRQ